MKSIISDLKKFINIRKKPKRNVVYKIGYDKFAIKKIIKNIIKYAKDLKIGSISRSLFKSVKNLMKK